MSFNEAGEGNPPLLIDHVVNSCAGTANEPSIYERYTDCNLSFHAVPIHETSEPGEVAPG